MTKAKNPRRMAHAAAAIPAEQRDQNSAALAKLGSLPAKPATKQAIVLELTRGEGGASLTAIVEATGWLQHTARAALSGLRKKGHAIEKFKIDGETCYAIKADVAQ